MSLDNEGEQLVDPAAVVVALTVGGVAFVNAIGGGGAQPEDVLPANAIAFAKLDLNPSAGQKLAAYRLVSKFPKGKDKVTSQDTSIKESIFGSIFTGPAGRDGFGLDFKKDVEPWLGDRIGVGVFPDIDGDKEPEVEVAIAYTDRTAAKAALDRAIVNAAKHQDALSELDAPVEPNEPNKTGYAFADGYVIVSNTTANATALVQAGKVNTLAKSEYAEDAKSLGSDQIGVAWADIAAVYKAIPQDQMADPFGLLLQGSLKVPDDAKNASGRFVMGLHADPSFLEVTGKGLDIKGADSLVKADAGTGAGMIASFPADVFGAATITSVVPALAVIGTAMACGIESGVVAADAALSTAKTTPEELAHWIERLSRRPQVERARQVIRLADARSESPRRVTNARHPHRTRIHRHRATGARVTDARGRIVARVDLMVRGVLVVEFDGGVKYEGAQGREALVAEKKREDLLRQLGYGIACDWSGPT